MARACAGRRTPGRGPQMMNPFSARASAAVRLVIIRSADRFRQLSPLTCQREPLRAKPAVRYGCGGPLAFERTFNCHLRSSVHDQELMRSYSSTPRMVGMTTMAHRLSGRAAEPKRNAARRRAGVVSHLNLPAIGYQKIGRRHRPWKLPMARTSMPRSERWRGNHAASWTLKATMFLTDARFCRRDRSDVRRRRWCTHPAHRDNRFCCGTSGDVGAGKRIRHPSIHH